MRAHIKEEHGQLPEVDMLIKTWCEHHHFKLKPQEQYRTDSAWNILPFLT